MRRSLQGVDQRLLDGRAADDREHHLLGQQLPARRATPAAPGRACWPAHRAAARSASARTTAPVPAAKIGIEKSTGRAPLQRRRVGAAAQVDAALLQRLEAVRRRHRHELDGQRRQLQLGLHRVGHLLAQRHREAGRLAAIAEGERPRVGAVAQRQLAGLLDLVERACGRARQRGSQAQQGQQRARQQRGAAAQWVCFMVLMPLLPGRARRRGDEARRDEAVDDVADAHHQHAAHHRVLARGPERIHRIQHRDHGDEGVALEHAGLDLGVAHHHEQRRQRHDVGHDVGHHRQVDERGELLAQVRRDRRQRHHRLHDAHDDHAHDRRARRR